VNCDKGKHYWGQHSRVDLEWGSQLAEYLVVLDNTNLFYSFSIFLVSLLFSPYLELIIPNLNFSPRIFYLYSELIIPNLDKQPSLIYSLIFYTPFLYKEFYSIIKHCSLFQVLGNHM